MTSETFLLFSVKSLDSRGKFFFFAIQYYIVGVGTETHRYLHLSCAVVTILRFTL